MQIDAQAGEPNQTLLKISQKHLTKPKDASTLPNPPQARIAFKHAAWNA
jgi:hypothetical protein